MQGVHELRDLSRDARDDVQLDRVVQKDRRSVQKGRYVITVMRDNTHVEKGTCVHCVCVTLVIKTCMASWNLRCFYWWFNQEFAACYNKLRAGPIGSRHAAHDLETLGPLKWCSHYYICTILCICCLAIHEHVPCVNIILIHVHTCLLCIDFELEHTLRGIFYSLDKGKIILVIILASLLSVSVFELQVTSMYTQPCISTKRRIINSNY